MSLLSISLTSRRTASVISTALEDLSEITTSSKLFRRHTSRNSMQLSTIPGAVSP